MRSTSLALRAAWLLLCLAQASSVRAQLQFKSESHGLVITHGQTKVVEYIHSDPQILRPHLTRAHSPSGYMLTRANPPVAGVDAVDHPTMHPGIWLAWGDINGQDFWRNKARIEHVRYLAEPTLDGDRLSFSTENRLLASDGAPLGQLVNHLLVAVRPLGTVIVWQATLKAGDAALKLGDQEEMGFGVRLPRRSSKRTVACSLAARGSRPPARHGANQPIGATTPGQSMVAFTASRPLPPQKTFARVGGTIAITVSAWLIRLPRPR